MKKGVFIMVAGIFLLLFFCSLAVVSAVSAQKDVGYILVNSRNVNQQVVSVFNEFNLTYELILDSKVRSYDLSKYKFLFIDDVRLNNARNLPIYNYPSVIMNRYYGPNWGLTDRDGISQMTSNSLMNVKLVDNGFAQVYTDTRYSLGGAFIPIYYLSDENGVDGASIARAFEGGGDSYNIPLEYGDVVEEISAGTLLRNNKGLSKANMCFFGIAKTGYWTNNARQLFLDCVGYVASRCSSDLDCPSQTSGARYCMAINAPYNNTVYQDMEEYSCVNPGGVNSACVDDVVPINIENCTDICVYGSCVDVECMNDAECDDADDYTIDKCVNPATLNSHCTHDDITCKNDLDCGTNEFLGDAFCSGNNKNVLRDYLSFTCNDAGTVDSYCSDSTSEVNLENCSDTCVDGTCKSITCYNDLDCDDQNMSTEDKCLNPGTLESSCKNQPIECFENSDCGDDGWEGNLFCSGKNLSRNYMSFMCNNPGTSSSFCSDSSSVLINQTCADACENGVCLEIKCYNDLDCDDGNLLTEDKCLLPGTVNSYCTNDNIACFNNIDCGTNSLSGNLCSGNNVVRSFTNYTCLNAGTANSYCGNFSGNYLVQTCSQQCQAGRCTVINCTEDSDCDDASARTVDTCVNPDTTASYCRNNEVNCLNNMDCGFNGFIGGEFCALNRVYKYYQNSTCINAGTLNSNCVVSQFPKIIQDCEDNNPDTFDACVENDPAYCRHDLIKCKDDSECSGTEVINNYCVGKEVWNNVSSGTCLNPGTISSSCSLNYNQFFNQTCSDVCVDGKCENYKCKNDLECGSNGFGSNFCSQDDVFKNYFSFTCNNANTALSFCSNNTEKQLVEDCGDDSYSEYGENYCIGNAVYKSRAYYNRGCSSSSCFVYAVIQEVNVENCTDVCVDGSCGKITCKNDSECGTSGFIGTSFCSGEKIDQSYIEFDCVNQGTITSYCVNSTINKNVGSCLFGCSDGRCTC
ncbi:MAG: hypothetical protein ABH840_00230 [Nanoarchaeota archaeon]